MADTDPGSKPSSGGGNGSGWGGGIIAFIVIGAITKSCSSTSTKPTATPPPSPPPAVATRDYQPPPRFGEPMAVARLNVSGRDGTGELQQLAAGMTQGEALALGLGVILTGTDTYAARIRVTNTGTVPVRVFPENILVHFGAESAVVTTVNHPRFLQRGVLQPGYYFDGLVMYRARIDIGAAMRLGVGAFSYNDDTVVVNYGP